LLTKHITDWLGRPQKPTALNEVPEFSTALGTTIGEVRKENQDRAVIARFTSVSRPDQSFLCFALCDGMGGLAEGGRCAEIALSAFLFGLMNERGRRLAETARSAVLAANAEVYRQYRERGGTTLIAIVLSANSGAITSVGDSRIYAISSGKRVEQISVDDTVAGALSKVAGVNEDDANWETFAGQLTQFVGMGNALEPRVYPLRSDSTYLLLSDGVHNLIGATFQPLAINAVSPINTVSRLLQVAKWCGGTDNATAMVMPPVKRDWTIPPAWSNGDWLELWDPSGRHDIDVRNALVSSSIQRVVAPEQPKGDRPSASRSRKRQTGSSKRKSSKTLQESPGVQGALQIEIVDNTKPSLEQNQPANPNPAPTETTNETLRHESEAKTDSNKEK
jgi:PPM family protein phosphatase